MCKNSTTTVKTQTPVNTPLQQQQQQQQQQVQAMSQQWAGDKGQTLWAGESARAIVKEFNPKKDVNLKSRCRRNIGYSRRKKIYDHEKVEAYRQKKLQAHGKPPWEDNPPDIQPTEADVTAMMEADSDIDFLGYEEDVNFAERYDEMQGKLDHFAALKDKLTGMDEQALKTFAANVKDLPSLEKLQKMADHYTDVRDFYRAKMEVLSSPYYMLLRHTDTDKLTVQEMQTQIQKCKDTGKTDLAQYLTAMLTLKKLRAKGVFREHDKYSREGALYRHDMNDGYTKNQKGYFKVASLKGGLSGVAGLAETDEAAWAWDNDLDQKEENREKIRGAQVGLEGEAEAKFKVAKGSYKYDNGWFEAGINASVGDVATKGKIGGSLGYDQEHGVNASLGVDAHVEGQIAKSRTKIGIHWKDWIGIQFKASGELGSGSADGYAKTGLVKVGDYGYKQDEDSGLPGFAAALKAEAYAASATGALTITICGVNITGRLTGYAGGIGGTVGGYVTAGSFGGEIGLLALFGLKAGLDVDATGLIKKIGKGIKKLF